MPATFRKRTFTLADLARSYEHLARDRRHVRHLDPAFRERVMLAVTQVNACIYCTALHRRLARVAGVDRQEVLALLQGELSGAPEHELPALVFAAHWAESRGRPDREAVDRLVETYGQRTADAIITNVRAIMFGNLYGNTFEAFKNRLTGGPRSGRGLLDEVLTLTGPAWLGPWLLARLLADRLRGVTAPAPHERARAEAVASPTAQARRLGQLTLAPGFVSLD